MFDHQIKKRRQMVLDAARKRGVHVEQLPSGIWRFRGRDLDIKVIDPSWLKPEDLRPASSYEMAEGVAG